MADKTLEAHILICSLGMQELHLSVVSSYLRRGWLDVHNFPSDRYTHWPLQLACHTAFAPPTAGIGIMFDWPLSAVFEIAA